MNKLGNHTTTASPDALISVNNFGSVAVGLGSPNRVPVR